MMMKNYIDQEMNQNQKVMKKKMKEKRIEEMKEKEMKMGMEWKMNKDLKSKK